MTLSYFGAKAKLVSCCLMIVEAIEKLQKRRNETRVWNSPKKAHKKRKTTIFSHDN
jgi:hypothetical protein